MTSPMKGWEAFGISGTEPEVRELGGDLKWPKLELCHDVAYIAISTHGDSPRTAFIRTCGPDRRAVKAAWQRANTAFQSVYAMLWVVNADEEITR